MKKTLNIFDPTIFPIAKSIFFFLAAITLVASSGRDVPIDIIVEAITIVGIFNGLAREDALSTKRFAPIIIMVQIRQLIIKDAT